MPQRSSCSRRGRATASASHSYAGPMEASAKFMSSARAADARAQCRSSLATTSVRASARTASRSSSSAPRAGDSPRRCGRRIPASIALPVDGGAAVRLTDEGREPHFVGNEGRIYFTADKSPAKESEPAHELVSVDANGQDRHVHARSNYANNLELSPTGEWLAFIENYQVYVVPMPPGGTIDLSLQDESSSAAARQRYRRHVHQLDRRRHAVVDTCRVALSRGSGGAVRERQAGRSPRQSRREPQHDAAGRQAARRRGAHRRPHRDDERRATGDRERHDRRARQSHRRRRRERRRGNSRRCAAARSRGPHSPARHHRCARAWTAGRERPRASTELVDTRASRARRHDSARPVEQRDRDFRCVRVSARRRDPRAAHLLDRRRRVRRTLGRLRQHRQAGRRTQSHPAAQGAGCDLDQELQPAAPRSAPDGDDGRTRGRHAGRVRRRLALSHGHEHGRRRQHEHRAQRAAGALLRRRIAVLAADESGVHADAGRDLQRPGQRALLLSGVGRVGASDPVALRAAADPAAALRASADGARRATISRTAIRQRTRSG